MLANAQHIKNVPGRKTDMKDAEWIAQLGRCGLIEPSYIPNPEVMQLRLLTRRLRSYKQRQTQIKNKIHNLLQPTNIKLTSYLSVIFSKTGQSLLMLFINGELIDYDNVTACIHKHVTACIHKHVKASPEEFNVGHEWEVVSEGSISLGPKPRRISIVSKTHE
ncbi:transposase [Streptococcus thermophilus]